MVSSRVSPEWLKGVHVSFWKNPNGLKEFMSFFGKTLNANLGPKPLQVGNGFHLQELCWHVEAAVFEDPLAQITRLIGFRA